MNRLSYFTIAVVAVFTTSCISQLGSIRLSKSDFDNWIMLWVKHPPTNSNSIIQFRIQVRQAAIKYVILKQNALQTGSQSSIDKIETLPRVLGSVKNLDSEFYFRLLEEFPELPNLQILAPSFARFVQAKQVLEKNQFALALSTIKTCPIDHPEVKSLYNDAIVSTAQFFSNQFDLLETSGQYYQLSDTLNAFFKIVQISNESPEKWPFSSIKNGKAYSNFGAYVSALRIQNLERLILRAQSLLNNKSQGYQRYKEAKRSAESALSITTPLRKAFVTQLHQRIITTGIQDCMFNAEKALKSGDYDRAYDLVKCAWELDPKINREQELQKIEQKRKRKDADELVKKAQVFRKTRLKDAIDCLDAALKIVPEDALIKNLLVDYRNELGLQHVKEGQQFYDELNWPSALDKFKESLPFLKNKEVAHELIGLTNDQIGRTYLANAAELATSDAYKEAVMAVRKARPLLLNKLEADRLVQQYKTLATKKLVVVFQTDNSGFSLYSRKDVLLGIVSKAVEPKLSEFVKLINSSILLTGNQSDYRTIADAARKQGANWALVISVTNYSYSVIRDDTPDQFNYCRMIYSRQALINQYPYPPAWIWLYDYQTVPVFVLNDQAWASLKTEAYLLNVGSNTRSAHNSRDLNASWSREFWSTRSDVNYREIRFCPCSCNNLIDWRDKTATVNPTNFEHSRTIPGGDALLSAKVESAFKDYSSTIVSQIDY